MKRSKFSDEQILAIAAPSLARAADASGLRRSRLRGPQAGVWGLLGGCSGHDRRAEDCGRTHLIRVADSGGRSGPGAGPFARLLTNTRYPYIVMS